MKLSGLCNRMKQTNHAALTLHTFTYAVWVFTVFIAEIIWQHKNEQSLNNAIILYCLSSDTWKVNYSKNINTDNVMHFMTEIVCNRINGNDVERVDLWMNDQNSCLDYWPIALLISSWLIITQQLFRTCFICSMLWTSDDIPATEERPKMNNPRDSDQLS